MKQAKIIVRGFFEDEVPFADGVPEWEEEYIGLFETYNELRQFEREVIEDPTVGFGLGIVTSIEVVSIRMIDNRCIDFDRWQVKY